MLPGGAQNYRSRIRRATPLRRLSAAECLQQRAHDFVDSVQRFLGQFHANCANIVVELTRPACSDDRLRDVVDAKHPGERELGKCKTDAVSDWPELLHDRQRVIIPQVVAEHFAHLRARRA